MFCKLFLDMISTKRKQIFPGDERKKLICGWARGGRVDDGVEKRHGDEQTDTPGRWRGDWEGPTPSEITDRQGDRPVSQSVSHIHSWPHYSVRPHPDTHNSSSVCQGVCVCVCVWDFRRFPGPTGAPTSPPLPQIHPCPLHVWVTLEPRWLTNPPKDGTATQKICLSGDEGRGSGINEKEPHSFLL